MKSGLVDDLLDIFLFEEAGEISALEIKQFGCFGLIPVAAAHGLLQDVRAKSLKGILIGKVVKDIQFILALTEPE